MAIEWGLGGNGFSALEALQAFGLGRQMQQQERTLARQEALASRQETGRVRVGEQVRAGDFVGAAGTAFESGLGDEIPNIQHLDRAQQGQLMRETQAGLAAIDALERITDDNQRGAFAQTLVGPLRQAGFDDREIAEYMQDLSIPTLQARRAYLTRLASGMGTQGRGGTPPSIQREVEYLRSIGRNDLAEARLARVGIDWARTEDPVTGAITMTPVPLVGGGAPQNDDDEWEYEGGPEQGAPATFQLDGWQPVDGSAYPPGQW